MHWYEEEVRHLESLPKEKSGYGRKVVFYGSSSIRLWNTLQEDFPFIQTVNLGFGGSTLAAGSWFFNRLVLPHSPGAVVLYSGDNDLGDGRHPEEVFLFFQTLHAKIRRYFGAIPFTFISIKPSIARWNLIEQIKYTNQLIRQELATSENNHYVDIFSPMLDGNSYPRRDLLTEDGLHLSEAGYQVWKDALLTYHSTIF